MHSRLRQHGGFTLIEIAVVIVLVGLLASAVAVASGGIIGGATREEAITQIGSLDAEARRLAKQRRRVLELVIDREGQTLLVRDPQAPSDPPLSSVSLPGSQSLTKLWRRSRGEQVEQTSLTLRYEPDGTSPTWGLRIAGPDGQEQTQSILILGMTGQMTVWENDEQAQDILAAALGRHAD